VQSVVKKASVNYISAKSAYNKIYFLTTDCVGLGLLQKRGVIERPKFSRMRLTFSASETHFAGVFGNGRLKQFKRSSRWKFL